MIKSKSGHIINIGSTAGKEVCEGHEPMTAEDVAAIIYYVETLPKNICINDLVRASLS